jgi:hypothetical protein
MFGLAEGPRSRAGFPERFSHDVAGQKFFASFFQKRSAFLCF